MTLNQIYKAYGVSPKKKGAKERLAEALRKDGFDCVYQNINYWEVRGPSKRLIKFMESKK